MFDNDYEEAFSAIGYDFIEVNSVVVVLSCHTFERFYLTNVTGKCIAKDMILKDLFCHVRLEVDLYFRGNYLQKGS